MSWPRLFAAIAATSVGLAFWWALTEPLPVPPAILLAVAAIVLICAGIVAGKGGVIAAPVGLLFSLFLGSLLSTQLHQQFRPATPPITEFGALVSLRFPEVLGPLAVSAAIGAGSGWLGELLLARRMKD